MKKLLIGTALTAVLVLAGCAPTQEPAPTVTVTQTAKAPAPAQNNSSSTINVEDKFVLYMGAVGIPGYMLKGEALDILINQARTVCGYIADGDSKEDITWMITLASSQSGVSDDIVTAFLAASVAGTYTYCPQYEGFWD